MPAAVLVDLLAPARQTLLFVFAGLAIVPLAGLMGRATDELAGRLGEGLGGLLNATFGNAAELIISLVALSAGHQELVKASLTGSIIGNLLAVFGLSALLGGLGRRRQAFNRTAASLGATLLALSVVGLIVPAVFHALSRTGASLERELSLEISVVLIVTYLLSLVFTLKTHRDLYADRPGKESGEESGGGKGWSLRAGLGALLVSAAMIGWLSEMLIGAVEGAARALGLSELFIGVVLLALIGNAAEHSTAVLSAIRGKMDLAMNIAVGSSMQIALFVAPLLVLVSHVWGAEPMDLRFTTLEVVAVGVSVGAITLIANDGETHWMEGVLLLAVYLILALAFYLFPAGAALGL